MHKVSLIIAFLVSAAALCAAGSKEEGVISFPDGKTFDFGDITLADGPQSCTFRYRNVSSAPMQIFDIISSCGCTTPEWSREATPPGGEGRIRVTFSNDQGPYPFDKTLTLYVSGIDRPVLLHIRGVVHEKNKPLAERFPVHLGHLGLRTLDVSLNYVDQGGAKSDRMMIANLGNSPLEVKAVGPSDGLSISVTPSPVAPRSTAMLCFSVDTRRMKEVRWGKETFTCLLSSGGRVSPDTLKVRALIREDFSSLSGKALEAAPVAEVEKSYFEFGIVEAGRKVTAVFTIRNSGKKDLVLRKIDSDGGGAVPLSKCPLVIKPGASATIRAQVDTKRSEGEVLSVLSIITNAPKKPVINLFVTGIINNTI